MKRMKWLVLSLSIIFIAVTILPIYAAEEANTFYVSKGATGDNNGTDWDNAWNELDQINWDSVAPGDTILIDGDSGSITYTTPLVIGKSGTSTNRIYVKLAAESGRNGKAIFWGGRSTPLPECGSHPSTWTLPNDLGRTDAGINFNGNSYVTVDGTKWKGIEIYGCNNTGVMMSGSNNTVSCALIYDNGGWGKSQDPTTPYDGSPWDPGIWLAGPGMTVEYCIIHDNGEDCIQDYWQSYGGTGFTLFRSWLYNSRPHTQINAAFNYAMHNDGIQFWETMYAKSNISISESIIGPGFMQTICDGPDFSNILMKDCLLFTGNIAQAVNHQNINFWGKGSNWTVDRLTLVRPSGADDSNIDCQNTTNMVIKNTISYGARKAGNLAPGTVFENNFQYGHIYGTEIGKVADPGFVNGTQVDVGAPGWDTFDFTPTNPEILDTGAGTYYTSLSKLIGTVPGSTPRPEPTPKPTPTPTPRPAPKVTKSIDELPAFLDYGAEEGLLNGDGILQSLKAKITNLPNNSNTILNRLNALGNEVKAQSGKKLEAGYAALLLSNINNLIEVYEAGGPEFIWYSAPSFSAVKSLGTGNTGIITTEFDLVPLQNNIDGVIGYTDTGITISSNGDMAINIWMNPDGYFKAMNRGWPYTSLADVPYVAGSTYHVKMTADMAAKKFDVWVTPPGGEPIMIAQDYAFRSTAASTDDLGKICLMSQLGVDQFKILGHTPPEAQ